MHLYALYMEVNMILFELKKAILEKGLKQTFIARQLGIDETTLSKKIHGYLPIFDQEKKDLAVILGKDVDDLFVAPIPEG